MSSDDQTVQAALTAAHYYYLQGRTMDAIAAELHTSRSTVSRLLKHARESGLVEIRINSPLDAPRVLEQELATRYGVLAHVAPIAEGTSEAERLDVVAATAARVLATHVEAHSIVGIAWGSTLAAVSRHLVPKATGDVRVVQLNGSGNVHTTGLLYASEMLGRFGRAFGAQVQQFPVPAFFDDPATKRALWRERSTRRILDLQARLDLVVFSVGSPTAAVPSHVYAGGYLEPSELAGLAAQDVVGDVATVFFRADGSSADIALNDRASGPALEDLAAVPRRLCIVAGEAKLDALRGAFAAGLVSDLVIDEPSARVLVEASSNATE